MAIFRKRLPSSQEALYAFAVCIFPIHVWAIINVMREVPAWILRLSIWDLIGVIAYSQLFALVETILLFLALVFLAFILPTARFRHKFVALSSVIVFLTSVWIVFLHYNDQIVEERQLIPSIIWVGSLTLFIAVTFIFIHRSERFETAIDTFVKRLAVLSFIYLLVDIVSLILVVI
ncbi:MAG: hypothetical protein GY803_04230, partial [Chloroflexi bacterium]|nr:hypothetical protein [Chloroflexota bacterium]